MANDSTKPVKMTAPAHVTAIALSTGRELRVDPKDGTIEVPVDATASEREQIAREGFLPYVETLEPAKAKA